VYLSLHIPGSMCVGVTLWYGCGGVVSICRLKHYWPVHVECGGWELMTVWNRGLVSPGLCFRNEFDYLVERLDIVLFVRQEYVSVI